MADQYPPWSEDSSKFLTMVQSGFFRNTPKLGVWQLHLKFDESDDKLVLVPNEKDAITVTDYKEKNDGSTRKLLQIQNLLNLKIWLYPSNSTFLEIYAAASA